MKAGDRGAPLSFRRLALRLQALLGFAREDRETRARGESDRRAVTKSVTLAVEGMHCTGCARTIEMLLGAEPGVTEAKVSFESKSARIVYDATVANGEGLAAAIEKAGFRAARSS